jgi:hypothetical protein
MKKVFPNAMVAHVWAQQKQDEGRSGNGNFSFSGPTIYSYGTPIANIVTGTRKRKGALLTSQSYSVTTEGKHKNATWRAWHGNGPSFTVPFLGVTGGRAFRHPDATNMKEVHKGNRSALFKQYQEYVARELRALRPWYGDEEKAIAAFQDQAEKTRAYCEFFGLHAPKIDHAADARKVWARFARLAAQRETPQWKAKQERAATRREERLKIAAYDRLQNEFVRYMTDETESQWLRLTWYAFPSNTPEKDFLENAELERNQAAGLAWRALFDAWKAGGPFPEITQARNYAVLTDDESAELTVAHAAHEMEKKAIEIQRWREGAQGSLYSLPSTLLRVRGDNVETSRGAVFPISHAVRSWPFILRAIGTGWKKNGHSIPLGHFTIDEIEPSGNVKAGCHYVTFAEVSAVADTLRAAGHELAKP